MSDYTEDEKVNIALQHLLTKQIERNGLKADEVDIEESAIVSIIRYYTREAGVRGLEREISKICRKAVRMILLNEKSTIQVTQTILKSFSESSDMITVKPWSQQIGQVNGLAWTGGW